MTDSSNLIERLRYTEEHGIFTAHDAGLAAMPGEAADHIKKLEADNARLRHVSGLLCNFATHDEDCRSHKLMGCNCGYTDAWKQWQAALQETSHD